MQAHTDGQEKMQQTPEETAQGLLTTHWIEQHYIKYNYTLIWAEINFYLVFLEGKGEIQHNI